LCYRTPGVLALLDSIGNLAFSNEVSELLAELAGVDLSESQVNNALDTESQTQYEGDGNE
jgi:hypothetical protein